MTCYQKKTHQKTVLHAVRMFFHREVQCQVLSLVLFIADNEKPAKCREKKKSQPDISDDLLEVLAAIKITVYRK